MIIQAAHRLPKEIRRLQMASKKTIKSAIESMMFVWGKPLDIKDVADVFNIDKKEIYEYFKESETDKIDDAMEELGGDYTEDEIRLVRIKFISEMAN